MDTLTRGQLARCAQVNPETVRFYENEGLLPPAPRTGAGYRKFSESAVERLMFIRRAKALGFSLTEIREILHLQESPSATCTEVRDLLKKKLIVVREKQAELRRLESDLRSALHKCNRALARQSQVPEACPVLNQMADSNPHKNHGGDNV